MPEYASFDFDVLVIGAGGAGLRAAIEASAAGVTVGLVCKSLLGKAHTVMAEGGMAAAMGNVDDRDNWKVHFADTMRGGQYINNWRMAELHAKQAPDRVRELEAWGAVFDRTKDGRILQRVRREVVVHALWDDPFGLDLSVQDGVVTLAGQVDRHSTAELAEKLTAGVDGVVGVVNQLKWMYDDTMSAATIPPSPEHRRRP